MSFDVKTEQLDGEGYVIALAGEVDLYTAPEFKQQLLDVIAKGAKYVVVDFTDTTFIDSTTLGVLVGGVKRLRTNDGQLALQDNNVLPPGIDPSSTLGQALSQDPLTKSLTTRLNEANTKAVTAFRTAENAYKRVATAARGTSAEAGAQLQLGSTATSLGDNATAIAAFERYLKLAPNGTNAAAVRQTIKQLKSSQPAAQG